MFRVDGRVGERLIYRGEETSFEVVETCRIRLAHLFDPYLAVRACQIEALPHQITAVYGEMLPRQPLRFLLADDPGAGKTIMAGLLVKELLIRGKLERCLIVAPGGLVESWAEEMAEKFSLGFDIRSRGQIEASITTSEVRVLPAEGQCNDCDRICRLAWRKFCLNHDHATHRFTESVVGLACEYNFYPRSFEEQALGLWLLLRLESYCMSKQGHLSP